MRMEIMKKFRRLAKPNDWYFSFKLQYGFHTLGIHRNCQKFIQFDIQGEVFRPNSAQAAAAAVAVVAPTVLFPELQALIASFESSPLCVEEWPIECLDVLVTVGHVSAPAVGGALGGARSLAPVPIDPIAPVAPAVPEKHRQSDADIEAAFKGNAAVNSALRNSRRPVHTEQAWKAWGVRAARDLQMGRREVFHPGFPMSHFLAHLKSSSASSTTTKVTVGTRLEVFWVDDDKFYPGVVKGFNEDGTAHVVYDDGDEENLNLSEEKFNILCSAGVSEQNEEAAELSSENIDCGGNYKENEPSGDTKSFFNRYLCGQYRSELGRSHFTDLAIQMQ
ncbi:hypothetical protein CYMTET_45210 [Cymbomonas tetramitiformis]|uniref:Tudor domain-containing protein n=1 Tax=Cymbomonas tetramitiformis TaxID=36881 RepID=A0AAE0EYT8_9CHLO|nr:hypothetical protein CYMTET_45210 [Cymbomonas tetramitiformis]